MPSPKDETVRGVRSALVSLEQTSNLDFGLASAGPSQPRGGLPAASANVKTCPTSDQASSAPSGYVSKTDVGGRTGDAFAGRNTDTAGDIDHTNKSGMGPAVRAHAHKAKVKKRKLACPLRKHDEIHGRHPSCNYQGAPNMSALRLHLKTRGHRDDILFIEFCDTCLEYVVHEPTWRTHHGTERCTPKKQTRGEPQVGAQWLKLYDELCAQSERHPSPCKSSRVCSASQQLT